MRFVAILFWIGLLIYLLLQQDAETNKGLGVIAVILMGTFLWWLIQKKKAPEQKDTMRRAITISVNYLDRESPIRWLLHHQEYPETVQALRSVFAVDVRFLQSKDYEAGYICTLIAECWIAIGNEMPPSVLENVLLSFDRRTGFFTDRSGKIAVSCGKLYLLPNGSIYASSIQYK